MSTHPFLIELKERILVCDGAMGTQLRKRIPPYVQCLDACNIEPDYLHIVQNIHREYRQAGADILQTNTYGANATKLKNYGLQAQVREINRAGAELAREIAGDERYVGGSVGPLEISPTQEKLSAKAIRQTFQTQMDALVEGGVDLLILETFMDMKETEIATEHALTYGLPVIVQLSGVSGGKLGGGIDVRVFALAVEKLGAHVVGVNCRGPHDLLDAVVLLAPVIKVPLSVQPNAGNPRIEQGKLEVTYSVSADVFDEYVQKLIKLGANIIGGCCGTTPAYISKIRAHVEGLTPIRREARIFIFPTVTERHQAQPENPIQQIFETRQQIVSVEMRANTFVELRAMLKQAKELAVEGVDLFDVPDSAGATVNVGGIGTAYQLQQETQIPTIIHWTTRSRNLISLQSHLLEAWALGIRGVLALSGDHPKVGPYDDTANLVRDVRGSIQLMALISRLNQGELADGASIGEPCNFYIGGGFTIAENLRPQVKHLANKVKNGAKFAYTQPAYTLEDIERTYEATKALGIKILYGILPITSFRSLSFLRDNLGMYIPQSVVDQFRDIEGEAGKAFGMKLILELVRQIRKQDRFPVDGIYIIPPPPMNWKNKRIALTEIIQAYRGDE